MPRFSSEVRIENSTICNYDCIVCPHGADFLRKRIIMSQGIFEELLNKVKKEAPQITECTISGFGEAFIDKGILDKIIYAIRSGYNVHVLTNGSLCTFEDILRMFVNGIKSLRFSFHSEDPNYYRLLTNTTIESKFLRVKKIINYAIDKAPHDTKIIITAVLPRFFECTAERLINEYADRCFLEIWKPHNWINTKNYRKKGKPIKTTCGRPLSGPLQIQVSGEVVSCCFCYNNQITLGNLRSQTLEEIFNSEVFLSLLEHHKNGTIQESDLICKHCDQLLDEKGILIYSNVKVENRIERLSTTYKELSE